MKSPTILNIPSTKMYLHLDMMNRLYIWPNTIILCKYYNTSGYISFIIKSLNSFGIHICTTVAFFSLVNECVFSFGMTCEFHSNCLLIISNALAFLLILSSVFLWSFGVTLYNLNSSFKYTIEAWLPHQSFLHLNLFSFHCR